MLLKWTRKKKAGVAILAGAALIAGGFGIYQMQADGAEETELVTKETKVQYGNLTVGITESGNVSIDSLTQSFSLEMPESSSGSSSSSESTSSGNAGSAGFGGAMQGIADMGTATTGSSGNSSSSSDASLVVEKVYVTNGQSVEKGDNLLKLTRESVEEVRDIYQSAYEEASEALEDAKLEYNSSKLTAEYEYKQKVAKGESAKTTYQATLASLSASVTSAKAAYQEAKNGVAELPSQIKELKKQMKALKNAKSGAMTAGELPGNKQDNTNTELPSSSSSTSDSSVSSSSSALSQLEQQILQKEQQLQQYKANLTNLRSAYHAAKKAQATGKIEAESVYEQTKIDSKNAKAVYQTTLSSLKEELKSAKEDFADAKEAKEEFSEYVKDRMIKAEYSGTLVSIGYQEGDSLSADTEIATYQDVEGVTISVSVAQEDVANIEVGDPVNIYLSAYEDEVFSGSVTSISTTSTGESTVSYPVEVTMTSNESKVYSGMSSEVIFVSKEVKDVLYVSNKAIKTEGTSSYVTLKKEDGTTQKTKVTTGFSDGHNVEIISGLEEGDIVLIESQVSQ